MVIDYAKSQTPLPPPKTGSRGLLLLIISIVLCAVLMLIVHELKSHRQPKSSLKIPTKVISHKAPTPVVTTSTTFDFYTLLPKMKVPVPQETDQPLQKIIPSINKAPRHYLLQVASVTNHRDAKHLRDKLAHQGFNAFIQQYPAANRVWYRVYIGPYQTLSNAEQSQRQLYQINKYNSLLISTNS